MEPPLSARTGLKWNPFDAQKVITAGWARYALAVAVPDPLGRIDPPAGTPR